MKKSDILLSVVLGALVLAVIGAFCDALSANEALGVLGVVAVFGVLPQLKLIK